MHSYKLGHNPNAKDMSDQDAQHYADEHNIGAEAAADAQLVGESSAAALIDEDAEGEPDKEPTPPAPKTPKTKAGRKAKASKTGTPAIATPAETVPPPSASIVPPKPVEKEKSPDKKRKRASKKGADEPVASTEKEEAVVETPKSAPKPRKKKAKADS
jgi:hypothetical protein